MVPTLVGQVPDDDLFTADDIEETAEENEFEDKNDFQVSKSRAASADLVRGRMFDVLFQGKDVS